MEHPWVGGMSLFVGLGHMTKMVAAPIHDKNPLKFFFCGTDGSMTMGLGMQLEDMGPSQLVQMMILG